MDGAPCQRAASPFETDRTMRTQKTKLLLFTLFLGATSARAQNALPIPDTLSGPTIDLAVQEGTWEFHPGEVVNTYGVNGDLLAPTIILQQGQDVTLNVTNTLPDLTTMHWHGLHVSAANDGGPHSLIYPDSTWSPSFTVLDKAGMYWYHPHGHGLTDFQVSMGIAGVIIVRDAEEAALDLPRTYGVDDVPLVLQTKAIVGGQIMLHTGLDSVVVTNGVRDAAVTLPAQVVRLRCLDGTSERSMRLGLDNGNSFHVIGSDGGLLAAPVPLQRLTISPGERYELLLDLTGMEGQVFHLMSYSSELPNGIMGSPDVSMMGTTPDGYYDNALNGGDFRLLRITVGAQTADPVTTIPSTLASVMPYSEADADVTRDFTLEPEVMGPVGMVEGPYTIDGALFDMGTVNETVELGATEIWTFTNNTAVWHPVHIHDIQFNILDRNDAAVPLEEQGRKDVVLVPAQGSARVITRFDDFADPNMAYMYHCHLLMHEDEGMMGQFLVVDPNAITEHAGPKAVVPWPNPNTGDSFMMTWPAARGQVTAWLTDATGRVTHEAGATRAGNLFTSALPRLAPGLYAVHLRDAEGQRARGTLSILH